MCRLPFSVTAAVPQVGSNPLSCPDAPRDTWEKDYNRDAQFMFSRVQEHVHQQTTKGLVPLRSCLSTRSRINCKHGFPKMLVARMTVICNGNYRRFNVRISGRRNALGIIIGRRTAAYLSGTMRGFAVGVGSNTHTAPNYRLPPCAMTHDPECSSKFCTEAMAREQPVKRRAQLLRLSKAINRASREMSGYYMGHF